MPIKCDPDSGFLYDEAGKCVWSGHDQRVPSEWIRQQDEVKARHDQLEAKYGKGSKVDPESGFIHDKDGRRVWPERL